jgi:hypothetical protein
MFLLPVADSLGILGVPEVVLVLRFDQPSPHEFALSGLAAFGFEAIALSLAAPVIGKKKLLAVQALVSSSGRLHRFQNQKEPVSRNRPNRRNKIPPGRRLKLEKKEEEFAVNLSKKTHGEEDPFLAARFVSVQFRR